MQTKRNKPRVHHPHSDQKITQDSHRDATDIGNIIDKYRRTGLLQGPGRPSGKAMMFTTITGETFHSMLNRVQDIQGSFAGLPSKIRKRFANNPEKLLNFMQDPQNLAEAIELGLVEKDSLNREQLERLKQEDLVSQAEEADKAQYEEWKRNKRANPDEFTDPFDDKEDTAKKKPRK